MRDPKAIVRGGYDRISYCYRADAFDYEASDYKQFLGELKPRLGPGDRVLDLGCGCGVPVGKQLTRWGCTVTGVDISETQVTRARLLLPGARFVRADMTEVTFPDASFEAAVSFFAIIHVPVEQHQELFLKVARWLVEGGLFLATLGHKAWTGTERDWHGAEMYWSHADAATYRTWLARAGLQILSERFVPEGVGGHSLFLTQVFGSSLRLSKD